MSKSFLYPAFVAILFSTLIIVVPVSLGVAPAYAQGPTIGPDDNNNQGPPGQRFPIPFGQQPFAQAGNFSFGPIASIQNDESGQPAWIVIGFWRGNLFSFNETTVATTTTTENGDGNASSLAAAAVFNANLRMIMIDGSHAHTHVITNFILSNVSSNENGTTTYTGNSTISVPEGAFADVPTTIKASGEVISILPDPSKVNEHYGNTPIYGAILQEENLRGPPRGPPPLFP